MYLLTQGLAKYYDLRIRQYQVISEVEFQLVISFQSFCLAGFCYYQAYQMIYLTSGSSTTLALKTPHCSLFI